MEYYTVANAKKKKPEFNPEELPFLEECCCDPEINAVFKLTAPEELPLVEELCPCEPEINAVFKLNVPEAAWGSILGNIQNQTDLMELLATKQNKLTEENAGDGISITNEDGIVKINNTGVSAEWGNIEGDITDQEDLVE